MKNKKGVFELQFNWIFVMAVGAIILIFFSIIVLNQRDIAEKSTSNIISRNLGGILTGSEVSRRTVNIVGIPDVKIEFECNLYRIGNIPKRFGLSSIFPPKKLESNRLITITQDWNLPYRVTNLLYLSSPKIRYIIVGDSDFAKEIFKSIPNETNKDIYGPSDDIPNKGDNQVKMIFVDGSALLPVSFVNMPKGTVAAIKINNGDRDKGEITFFEAEGVSFDNKGTSYYIRMPTLLGAVFAGNKELYECSMENSFKKLNIVSQVYKSKTNGLYSYYQSNNDDCSQHHDDTYIMEIIQESEDFNTADADVIDTAAKNLEEQNRQAEHLSCVLVY